jgi:hypothetical protein
MVTVHADKQADLALANNTYIKEAPDAELGVCMGVHIATGSPKFLLANGSIVPRHSGKLLHRDVIPFGWEPKPRTYSLPLVVATTIPPNATVQGSNIIDNMHFPHDLVPDVPTMYPPNTSTPTLPTIQIAVEPYAPSPVPSTFDNVDHYISVPTNPPDIPVAASDPPFLAAPQWSTHM